MSVRAAFQTAAAEGRAALVPFIAAGDPDLDATVAVAQAAAEAGADVLEIGVPYSDPLADGPVIQAAYTRALAGGATLDGLFAAVARIAGAVTTPVVLMTSISPVLARGMDRFCQDAADAGAAGILVPDLLPEDAEPLRTAADSAGLETVFLTVPWADDDRARAAAEASTGFVYLVSRRGVTGEGGADQGGTDKAGASGPSGALERAVDRVRTFTNLPVAVGFGVATPEDAAEVAAVADGVIVGTTLVRAIHDAAVAATGEGSGDAGAAAATRTVVSGLRAAVDSVERAKTRKAGA
ncbi:MAG TPA: tryptophan synthase subunit alpha [Longimicrobiales bacterium]|nr:tryptophan synthase subunit alpha [Longimicrobiales bacterium]